jgi:succinate dehydrogenase / fumarate reductase, cytochrome b subunit
MTWLLTYVRSSIGKKQVMAVTGALLLVFVVLHLAGNLLVFVGRDAMNSYAQRLRDLAPLLWTARAGLLVVFAVHVVAAVSLFVHNRRARRRRYQVFAPRRTTYFARTMALSGAVLLLFVVFHLLHFTFGTIQPDNFALVDQLGRHDVYGMVVRGFQNPLISATYLVALSLLATHLAHGFSSAFQTMGARHPKVHGFLDVAGPVVGIGLLAGYALIPLAALIGFLEP